MRGTPPSSLSNHSCCGIIPAYAGNTRLAAWSAGCRGDHPRVCGEHVRNSIVSWCSSGSSPRMRGTRVRPTGRRSALGIIPAYAGNTRATAARPQPTRDHPRVCGEHTTMATWFMPLPGSSPRMRGTRGFELGRLALHGIIPAYAGNTTAPCPRPCFRRDHPRVCGEHLRDMRRELGRWGSSPRMRGTRDGVGDCLGG